MFVREFHPSFVTSQSGLFARFHLFLGKFFFFFSHYSYQSCSGYTRRLGTRLGGYLSSLNWRIMQPRKRGWTNARIRPFVNGCDRRIMPCLFWLFLKRDYRVRNRITFAFLAFQSVLYPFCFYHVCTTNAPSLCVTLLSFITVFFFIDVKFWANILVTT